MDLRLQHGDTGDWTLRALIDSGAPITFFDRGAGEAVGVRFGQAGAERGTIRIFGGTWTVQFEHVDLTLPAEPELTWEARVGFVTAPEFQMPFQGALGTDGFLDKFAVTFNKYYEYFVVERPDDFHERVGRHLTTDPTRTTDHRWLRGGGLLGDQGSIPTSGQALGRPSSAREKPAWLCTGLRSAGVRTGSARSRRTPAGPPVDHEPRAGKLIPSDSPHNARCCLV